WSGGVPCLVQRGALVYGVGQVRVGIALVLRRAQHHVDKGDVVAGGQQRAPANLPVELGVGVVENPVGVGCQPVGEGHDAGDVLAGLHPGGHRAAHTLARGPAVGVGIRAGDLDLLPLLVDDVDLRVAHPEDGDQPVGDHRAGVIDAAG